MCCLPVALLILGKDLMRTIYFELDLPLSKPWEGHKLCALEKLNQSGRVTVLSELDQSQLSVSTPN